MAEKRVLGFDNNKCLISCSTGWETDNEGNIGAWLTDENGNRYFIRKGETAQQAYERLLKQKEFRQNTAYNEILKEQKKHDGQKTIFSQNNAEEFVGQLSKAKASVPETGRWRVDVHEAEDYSNDKLFVTAEGSCVAIEPDGNIISVCRANKDVVRGSDLLKKAIENGGDRLDAFSGLYEFYAKNGFEPVSWVEFNEEYAPEGWNKKRDAKEPVVFWRYTGKQTSLDSKEFFERVKPSKDYDTAKQIRDRSIK